MDNGTVAGLTISVMVAASTLYDKTLPPAHQLVDQAPTAANVGRVRRGCARTAPVAIALGVGASLLAKSPWPAVGAALVVAWMWWEYEEAAHAGDVPAAVVGQSRGRYA